MLLNDCIRRICVLSILCLPLAIVSPAQTFTVVKRFNGTNGSGPAGRLIQGTDGNFYGTTYGGGTSGHGTVFRMTPAGIVKTLYSFCRFSGCTDGENPLGGVVQGSDGAFYGTTHIGGSGSGTVFKVTKKGVLTTLYSFCSLASCADGELPEGSLTIGANGNFYGTTEGGGAASNGTVFKISRTGVFTTLHSFCGFSGCPEGAYPYAGLALGTDGNFYGTTHGSGANNWGTVFRITPGGTLTNLYNFCPAANCPDGGYPQSGLVEGKDLNFYGTTSAGGTSTNCADGCGTIFRITPLGVLTTLHSFAKSDGAIPQGEMAPATDGDFYGTTEGASFGNGSVFRISSAGAFTNIRSLSRSDGIHPIAGLMQASNGNIYGSGSSGGTRQNGTIFSVTP
jgi:uncharacterized repeat protein (TIGR03803 family)